MDFKSLLSQLDQLNEATEKTKTGLKHTAEPGGYGRKDDEDEEGNKIKDTSTEKRGKGRPKKATQSSGEDKKYDFSAFGVKSGKDIKLPKYDKKKTTKHSLKEYFDQLDQALNEEGYSTAPMPGAVAVKDASGKVVATAKNPAAAAAFEKGDITIGGGEELKELSPGTIQSAAAKRDAQKPGQMSPATQRKDPMTHMTNRINMNKRPGEMDEDFGAVSGALTGAALGSALGAVKGRYGDMKQREQGHTAYTPDEHKDKPRTMVQRLRAAAGIPSKNDPNVKIDEKDIGKHNNATTGFDALVRKLTPKYGKEAATKIAGAQMKKIKEAEMPTHDGDMGAGLGAGRSQQFEGKKPDFLDLDKDGNKKESMKKAAQDKKKVKESMNENLLAARLKGKHDGIKGHSHCGKNYQDMEEARCYHEGYKEGLDECYGQTPIQGMVGEVEGAMPAATLPGMASQEQHGGMDEGNAFTAALARTPSGGSFKVGGTTFKDRSGYDAKIDEFAFEALDSQLNALLESKEDVAEGMTVSISKGQQGAPDSVSVSAQDGEADQLLSIIKSAGLGLFGGEETNGYGAPQGGNAPGGISVVDDHDGMMALMRKLSGAGEEVSGGDYEDEEGSEEHGHDGHEEHEHEEVCEVCNESPCGCNEQQVDEVESEDQELEQVAENNPPDSGADNTNADVAGQVGSDEALAKDDAAADEEEAKIYSSPTNEAEDETGEEAGKEELGEDGSCKKCDCNPCRCETMSESSFFALYKKIGILSEESTSEKDDKAEKAAKKVAKDIEYDEDHKGKDDDKAEEAGKKVKKDIEYDDKKDKKEKIDEWANDAGPGKSVSDTTFEADIDFMMNIISGGLNKRKQTGQTTIPVLGTQMNRMVSHSTTDINESKMLNESVSDWKKLAGI
jgi:hypothetical protein